jgi:hypothetical protein
MACLASQAFGQYLLAPGTRVNFAFRATGDPGLPHISDFALLIDLFLQILEDVRIDVSR